MATNTERIIYTRLPVLRAERKMSQKELAAVVGVHYQTIGYLERGEYNPGLALAIRIARHFELPVEAVFSLEPMPTLSQTVYSSGKEESR